MSQNRITSRMNTMGERARNKVVQTRLEKLDRDNDRLRTQVDVLRDDLDEERGALKAALDALKQREQPITVKTSRRPHLFRSVVIAGVAYVLGTRDGRERYEQIRQRVKSLAGNARSRIQDGRDPWSATPNGTEATNESPTRLVTDPGKS